MCASRLLNPQISRSRALLLPGKTFSFRCLKIWESRSAKICFLSLRKQLAFDRLAVDARSCFSLRDAFLTMARASLGMSSGSYFSTQRSAEAVACRSNVPLLILPLDLRLPSFSASFASASRARFSEAERSVVTFVSCSSSSTIRCCSAAASAASWRSSRGARCDGRRSEALLARPIIPVREARESGENWRCPYARYSLVFGSVLFIKSFNILFGPTEDGILFRYFRSLLCLSCRYLSIYLSICLSPPQSRWGIRRGQSSAPRPN